MVPKLELSVPIARYSAVSFTVSRGRLLFVAMKKGVSAQSVWCHTHLHWINDVERTKAPKRTHDTSTAF
jgi:hypothetical protein